MGRTKLTAAEQVVHQSQKSSKGQEKLYVKLCENVLKVWPSLAAEMWQKCQHLGKTEAMLTEALEELMAAKKATRQAKAAAKPQARADPDFVPKDPVPRTAFCLGDLLVEPLRTKILPAMEPSVLSSSNLRAQERNLGGKTGLLRIVEFITGLGPEFPLSGEMRCFEHLTEMMKRRSMHRGRRGADVVFPMQWEASGVYKVEGMDEVGVQIRHSFAQTVATVPFKRVPKCSDLADLTITENWSETTAKLASKRSATDQGEPVHGYFETQTIENDATEHFTPRRAKRLGSFMSRSVQKQRSSPHPLRPKGVKAEVKEELTENPSKRVKREMAEDGLGESEEEGGAAPTVPMTNPSLGLNSEASQEDPLLEKNADVPSPS